MADQIRQVVDTDVTGEGQLRNDGAEDRPDEQPEDARIERLPAAKQQRQRGDEDRTDEIFARNLERGQSPALARLSGFGLANR